MNMNNAHKGRLCNYEKGLKPKSKENLEERDKPKF